MNPTKQILTAEQALTRSFHALRALPADRPTEDTARLDDLLALVSGAAKDGGLTLTASRTSCPALRNEIDALRIERDRLEREIRDYEALIPASEGKGGDPGPAILRRVISEAGRRAAAAETELTIERARRAQAERRVEDIAIEMATHQADYALALKEGQRIMAELRSEHTKTAEAARLAQQEQVEALREIVALKDERAATVSALLATDVPAVVDGDALSVATQARTMLDGVRAERQRLCEMLGADDVAGAEAAIESLRSAAAHPGPDDEVAALRARVARFDAEREEQRQTSRAFLREIADGLCADPEALPALPEMARLTRGNLSRVIQERDALTAQLGAQAPACARPKKRGASPATPITQEPPHDPA